MKHVLVERVRPNPEQPRVEFGVVEIESLARSIKEQGLIQPIVVREDADGYVLVDGERRLRAVKLLGSETIEAKVIPMEEDVDQLTLAVVANMQRADLNPIEEGVAFKKLHESGMTLRNIARLVGRSNTHVSFRIKLLEFEPEIQELFAARLLPIDPATLYKVFEIPSETRVKMMRNFAANGTSCTVMKRVVLRYLNAQDKPDVPLTGRKRSPVEIMSDATGVVGPMASVLEEGEVIPSWELVMQAAAETCKHCSLHDYASAQTCRDCPAVEMLKRLKVLAKDRA